MFMPVNGDRYRNNVVLHLPMTGANNSTTFTDVSPSPKTITRSGDTKISTAQSRWGQGSGLFDGTGDYLSVADHADWSFSNNPFTVEFWIYQTETPGGTAYWGIVGQGVNTASNHSFLIYYNASLQIICTVSNGTGLLYSGVVTAGNNSLNAWHHCAVSVVPAEGKVYGAFNGVISVGSHSAFTVPNCSLALEIGRYTSGHYLKNAYLQDLRITKGVARYTADFTPPSGPLPDRLPEYPVQRIQPHSFHQIARLGL